MALPESPDATASAAHSDAPLTRADLAGLPSYVPGRRAVGPGQQPAIRLASNEVPYGPLPGVIEALTGMASQSHRYPDMAVAELAEKLARSYDLDPAQVVTGCGSTAVAEHVVRATALPGDNVIFPWRSFEAYPIMVAAAGVRPIPVPLTAAGRVDLAAMADAITDKTRLIFVCSPNNPTGPASGRAELTAFLDRVPSNILVVLDEAYHEFVTDPDVPNGLTLLADHPNVAVLRTFSKAWGLAGLRIGWLAANPTVATDVRKVVTPFSSSAPAQLAAIAALDQADEVRRRCDLVIAERARVHSAVRALGIDSPESQSNFIWLPVGDRATTIVAGCDAENVLVRGFANEGVRVTISTPEENDLFLAALTKTLNTTPLP